MRTNLPPVIALSLAMSLLPRSTGRAESTPFDSDSVQLNLVYILVDDK